MTMSTITFLVLAGVAGGGGDDAIAQVRLRPQALVRGVEVLLKDVAEIACDDPLLRRRLAEVSFGRRPARGFNRTLNPGAVRSQLAIEGMPAAAVEVLGADETIVQSVHTIVQPHEIVEIAEPILRAAIADAGGDIDFELTGQLSTIEVPPGRRTFDLRGRLRGGELRPSSAMVEVAVVVDDAEFRLVQVPYRLRHYGTALVVTDVVRRESPLHAGVLEARRMELAPGAETLHFDSLDTIAGKVAARDLRRGQVLRLGDVAEPAVIRPKDPVVLVVSRGRIQVTTRAWALASAAVGDRVMVTTSSNKVVQGIARGPGLVVVPATRRQR